MEISAEFVPKLIQCLQPRHHLLCLFLVQISLRLPDYYLSFNLATVNYLCLLGHAVQDKKTTE